MKSILQEASTIAKAIDQAWREAGEPQEFSVKILELPQHNFIGLTTRSAKIAFLFNGTPLKTSFEGHQKSHQKAYVPREKKETFTPSAAPQPRQQHAQPQAQPQPQAPHNQNYIQREQRDNFAPQKERSFTPEASSEVQSPVKKRPEGFWTEDMVAYAHEWFGTALKHMDRPDITFTVEPQTFYLRITLSKPVFAEEGQEKHLLASISSLMLATIKKQFRKALRGHKIVLTHVQN
jgi:hypothetical protein